MKSAKSRRRLNQPPRRNLLRKTRAIAAVVLLTTSMALLFSVYRAGAVPAVVGNSDAGAASTNSVQQLAGTACAAVPPGLIAWWRAEGNSNDETGYFNGTLGGNTSFAAGL
ncbi:MAG TPA: hypothetical protein VGM62_00630, partial [Chthoniobacterales bacterium]